MKVKQILKGMVIGGLLCGLLAGCSQKPEETAPTEAPKATDSAVVEGEKAELTGVTIEFLYNLNGEAVSDKIQEICQRFTDETGIVVEAIMPGSSFSDVMKTRMASNQLPDVWTTHGWAVARYSEYLEPLNDQPFADDIMGGIKDLITDDAGTLYCLPIDMDLAGIAYNGDVLSEAGVNPEEIKTWADFEAACDKILAAGKTPVHIGGKDSWTIGNVLDYIAPTLYTNGDEETQQALKDGTFDWRSWEEICDMLISWNDRGYINNDSITADYMTSVKAMGRGDVGFSFYGASGIMEAAMTNPNADMGFIPLPAKDENGSQTLISGEHFAVGVWKDTQYTEEAMLFLNFLARADICTELATICGMPAGISTADSDTGLLKPFYEKYDQVGIASIPYFDREYLPSGMWNDLCVTGALILSGQPDSVKNAIEQMEQSYLEKMDQQGN